MSALRFSKFRFEFRDTEVTNHNLCRNSQSEDSNGKSSSTGTDQADHVDQAGQMQIKQDKCRLSGSCRRESDQTNQIIYYNL